VTKKRYIFFRFYPYAEFSYVTDHKLVGNTFFYSPVTNVHTITITVITRLTLNLPLNLPLSHVLTLY